MPMRWYEFRVLERSTSRGKSCLETRAWAFFEATACLSLPGCMMTVCIQCCVLFSLTLGAIGPFRFHSGQSSIMPSLQRFSMNYFETGNLLVPFQQRGNSTSALARAPIELPHGVDDVIAMRVQNVRAFVSVPCQVILNDPIHWNPINEVVRIQSVVEGADVNIVDVEENATVRLLSEGREKVDLCPRRSSKFQIGRRIFEN